MVRLFIGECHEVFVDVLDVDHAHDHEQGREQQLDEKSVGVSLYQGTLAQV